MSRFELNPAADSGEKLHRLEEQLRWTGEKYEALLNSIDAIVWEGDARTCYTFVSGQAERLLGYPVEEWVGDPGFWVAHLHPDDREWVVSFCRKATDERQDHSFIVLLPL